MNTRLAQIVEKFIKKVTGNFSQDEIVKLDDLETRLSGDASGFIVEMLAAYAEMIDEGIFEHKAERKEAGIIVHKRNVSREYLSKFGLVKFNRRYYEYENQYGYLTDRVVGLEAFERVSGNVSADLVDKAANMSYQRSCIEAVGGKLSRQTTKNKIRKTKALELVPSSCGKKVKILHVVADEDHVAMQSGKRVIVPLITVHEGTEPVSKGRNRCINAKHFASYGKKARELWEEVSAWINAEYDFSYIERIYLHGDGAAWIKIGIEVLPECRFVLDKYHLQKWVTTVTGGPRKEYAWQIRKALKEYDIGEIKAIADEMITEVASNGEAYTIQSFWSYISNNWTGIEIRRDEARCGGSCTEAQISHVLSERLSRGPMGWSEEGLKHMSRLRVFNVNGGKVTRDNFVRRGEEKELSEMESRVVEKVKEIFAGFKDYSVFETLKYMQGKVTPINALLKSINGSGFSF